ncbi:MAG: AAA family ATPase [Methylococcaceae bacterium]|nr:AAA family ATPase [Methylococcaceae bacterium]
MNPFLHGNPVTTHNFLGRQDELNRIKGRVITRQSTAIVSEPRTGKTSVLLYLSAPENQTQLYNDTAEQLLFSYLDALTFGVQINQADFWILVLAPLYTLHIEPNPESKLASLYQKCLEGGFSNSILGVLLDHLQTQNLHVVLLVDEFDAMLSYSNLCGSEFFGGLRSLASLKPAFTLVIASRQSVDTLNKNLLNAGSPYLNIFHEYHLLPFTDDEVEILLNRANGRFSPDDKSFIKHAAGNHPYLLQAVAAELWDCYEDDNTTNPDQRRHRAGQALYNVVARTLGNTWAAWSPHQRMALTLVALQQSPQLLGKRLFNHKALLTIMPDLTKELEYLETHGYIKNTATTSTPQWRILPAAFHWWLADELLRTVRNEADFAQWLRAQEFDGLLTKKEQQLLMGAGKSLLDTFKGGLPDLIKSWVTSD